MKKGNHLTMLLLLLAAGLFGQRSITGTVTSTTGEPLIGANVVVKGTAIGTVTDIDGSYQLEVPEEREVLVFTYTGFAAQEVEIAGRSVIDVSLEEGLVLDEAVVTALGISREKKSLGYSTQEVEGEKLTIAKTDNFLNTLSGQASGVQVRRTNNMGGSTNVIIRGNTSLQGNNQVLCY